jgi:uncharacterized protein with HEPN domain
MKRATAKRLLDARNACLEIEEFTAGKSVDLMWQDRGLQLILHKLLEIVGEALNQAYKHDQAVATSIPHLRRIVDMRNQITHGYDSVDYAIVWQVATQQIPPLHQALDALLAHSPSIENPEEMEDSEAT